MPSAALNIDDSARTTARDLGPSALLEPETLLPCQYYDPNARLSAFEGERRLMLAVLEDAIYCFMKYSRARSGSGRKLFAEASRWIMQPQPHWLYSFESICSTLGIDCDGLRARLNHWLAECRRSTEQAAPRVPRVRWRVGRARRVRPPRVRNRTPRPPRLPRGGDLPLAATA